MNEEEFEAYLNDPAHHADNNLWHSNEPWRVSENREIFSSQEHYPIAIVSNEHGERSIREDRINAERIVACVNFCAGITNGELAAERLVGLAKIARTIAS